MTCPYSQPDCLSELATDAPRCLCGGYVKRCSRCATRSRAFAVFCRGCGTVLPPLATNWAGYKGGSRRLGATASAAGSDCVSRSTDLRLRLGDACRSLLGYDGHLIAISVSGVVEIADPLRAKSVCRFQTQGPITAEPCISDGVLYLAMRGQLSAYAMAALVLEPPRVRPLWQVPLNGTPIHALTAAAGRLYVTVATADWREVHVVEQRTVRSILGAPKMSWVAADPSGSSAVFLSEEDGRVRLHVMSEGLATHPVALHTLADHPIALLGGKVFGIFGEAHRLYRIDAANGAVHEPLDEDTQLFALTRDAADDWDRDGVGIDTGGIAFWRSGVRDSFAPHERASKGSPVIVQCCAAAVGMEDGRVLLYNLAQLPRHEVWRLGNQAGAAITALASFESYIAAGNREGMVEVRELLSQGAGQ